MTAELLQQWEKLKWITPELWQGKKFYSYCHLLMASKITEPHNRHSINMEAAANRVETTIKIFKPYMKILDALYDVGLETLFSNINKTCPNFAISSEISSLKDSLTEKELLGMRNQLMMFGSENDPMHGWYPFIRNMRRLEPFHFQQITGPVLIAHDFYIAAELLTWLHNYIFGAAILEPEDVLGGDWRTRECQRCHNTTTKMRSHDSEERYCDTCKEALRKKSGVRDVICANTNCNTSLTRLTDGHRFFNQISHNHKKFEYTMDLVLAYGKIQVDLKCGNCGTVTRAELRNGWDT